MRALFLGMHYAKWVSGKIRDSSVAMLHQNDSFFVTLERILRALFLGMHYAKWVSGEIRDSSSLTSFVPPE